ncbi:MAG: acyl-CoA thioesterase II [Deltaproteobacteria bacterium]|nr:acyl-CoA thioesterase II [Deltaproteobacteria bacterium]
MRNVLQELVELLKLERIEQNIFRGQSQDLGWGTVFGGQVLGQSLSAAEQTVPTDHSVHSLHGYFLRVGAVDQPIVYEVDCIRDGKSFTTRRVVAIQKGRAIFNMSASFQRHEEGFEHQGQMPEVVGPEGLLSERELLQRRIETIPEVLRKRATAERPIEIRPIQPNNPMAPVARPPVKNIWFKTTDQLPDDHSVHQYLLAYAADFHLLVTAMLPHGVSWLTPGMQVASVDHAMWFHRPFRMDDWLLYSMESPSASNARGLARGQIFTQAGVLVASTAQEGLMRMWPDADKS